MSVSDSKQLDIDYHKVIAAEYHKVVVEPRAVANDILFNYFDDYLKDKNCMLDIGCGTGHMLLRYANQYQSCIGIDHSYEMLAEAKKNNKHHGITNVTLIETDLLSFLSLNNKKYDLITMVGCLHHLQPEQFEKTLTTIREVLTDDGRFLLAEPIETDFDPPKDLMEWNSQSLAASLTYSKHAEDPDEAPIYLNRLLELTQKVGLNLVKHHRTTEIFPHRNPPSEEDITMIRYFHHKYGSQGHVFAGLFEKME